MNSIEKDENNNNNQQINKQSRTCGIGPCGDHDEDDVWYVRLTF